MITTEVAVIETEAVHLEGHDEASLVQFHAGGSLRGDFGNWYVPTIEGLHALCRPPGSRRFTPSWAHRRPLPLHPNHGESVSVEGSRACLGATTARRRR